MEIVGGNLSMEDLFDSSFLWTLNRIYDLLFKTPSAVHKDFWEFFFFNIVRHTNASNVFKGIWYIFTANNDYDNALS